MQNKTLHIVLVVLFGISGFCCNIANNLAKGAVDPSALTGLEEGALWRQRSWPSKKSVLPSARKYIYVRNYALIAVFYFTILGLIL
jgi:hypothetical protein